MGALGWEIRKHEELVIVSGVGVLDLSFFLTYLREMQAAGVANYRKLFDLRQCDIQMSADDLECVAESARNSDPANAGPVAILLGKAPPPLLVDMAILMKHRVGTARRFRLFKEEAEARRWLAMEPIANGAASNNLIAFDVGTAGPRQRQ